MPDILTLEQARYALNIGQEDHTPKADEMLPIYLDGAERALVAKVGPIVSSGTVVEEHDGGQGAIWLRQHPLRSVTQVVEYDGLTAGTLTAESNTSKPTAGYRVNLTNGKLTRRNANYGYRFPCGEGNVVVTYTPGRFAAGTITDDRYIQAVILILKNAWRAQENNVVTMGEVDVPMASFPKFTIPNAVKELLGDQWHAGSGIGD